MYYQTLLDKFTHAVKEITGEKLTGNLSARLSGNGMFSSGKKRH